MCIQPYVHVYAFDTIEVHKCVHIIAAYAHS